jgi:hypothetical protein
VPINQNPPNLKTNIKTQETNYFIPPISNVSNLPTYEVAKYMMKILTQDIESKSKYNIRNTKKNSRRKLKSSVSIAEKSFTRYHKLSHKYTNTTNNIFHRKKD